MAAGTSLRFDPGVCSICSYRYISNGLDYKCFSPCNNRSVVGTKYIGTRAKPGLVIPELGADTMEISLPGSSHPQQGHLRGQRQAHRRVYRII